jgi:hypothetical protein
MDDDAVPSSPEAMAQGQILRDRALNLVAADETTDEERIRALIALTRDSAAPALVARQLLYERLCTNPADGICERAIGLLDAVLGRGLWRHGESKSQRNDGSPPRLVVNPQARAVIRRSGGMLFVWPVRHVGPRCVLTLLRASVDPPDSALEFARFELSDLLLFLGPTLPLPRELWVEACGRWTSRLRAYWNGLAYVA